MAKHTIHLLSLIFLLILLMCGCIADNNTRQGPLTVEHKPQIVMPAPIVNTQDVDTGKIVEDTAARVRADMSSNNSQLSGHIVAQLDKLEANLKGLINLEAKIDSNIYAQLHADLTATITAVASFKVHLENNMAVTNEMRATLTNQMKLLSDINFQVSDAVGQAKATASAQVGLKNSITDMQTTLQSEIRATAGRDVNMWPMSAVITVLGIMIIMGSLIYGVTLFIGKKAYDNARASQENYVKLLAQAMGELEPDKARGLIK
jgi:hypothetical protein